MNATMPRKKSVDFRKATGALLLALLALVDPALRLLPPVAAQLEYSPLCQDLTEEQRCSMANVRLTQSQCRKWQLSRSLH